MPALTFNSGFDFSNEALIDFGTFAASDTLSYGWNTTSGLTAVTLLSGFGNITTNASNQPLTGTIDAVVVRDTTLQDVNFTITGLNAAITAFLPLTSDAFYRQVLAGDTTIEAFDGGDLRVFGDGSNTSGITTFNAGNDRFEISQFVGTPFLQIDGDVIGVEAGTTLNAGDDTILARNEFGIIPLVTGDALISDGTTNGGDDKITVSGSSIPPETFHVIGDVQTNNGVLLGGSDTIDISLGGDMTAGLFIVSGDAGSSIDNVTGGNDRITFTGTSAQAEIFEVVISGDLDTFTGGSAVVNAGNDTIVVENVQVNSIVGDIREMSAGTLNAGDDTIIVRSTVGQTISGDTLLFTNGLMRPGDDRITGGDGADTIFGESSDPTFPNTANTLVIGKGNDIIFGGKGNDFIKGQVGNDTLDGGRGNDTLNGGSGIDTVRFDGIAADVYVDLQGIAGTSLGFGNAEAIGQGIDQIELVERIIGSRFSDSIAGDAQANSFSGLEGNDKLNGRDGNDRLTGGLGRDFLTGGLGDDTYDFNSITELTTSSTTTDQIRGFAAGDIIDLIGIDARASQAGDQAFTLQSTPLTGEGQVTFEIVGTTTIISGSTDADADAEFVIFMNRAVGLVTADFAL